MGARILLMADVQPELELDDRQLVASIRAGETGLFDALVRRKTSKVFGLCYRLLSNSEDAKDVSQLSFVKVWENLEKYDPQYNFDTWLYRIVTNVAIDFIRSRQSREATVNSSLRLVKTNVEAQQTVSLQHKEIEEVFAAVSSALSPKQKTIFIMNQMEDISSAEISRILGCRESTVRNHLFNARKVMQKQLKLKYPEYARLWEDRE